MNPISQEKRVRNEPGIGEQAYIVSILLLCNGAFLNLLPNEGGGNRLVAGSLAMQMLWAGLYLGVGILLLTHCKGFARLLLCDLWLFALLALAFISTLWSSDPGLTIKRSIGLLGTYVLALYLVMRYDIRTQVKLIGYALGCAVILSITFGLFSIGECGVEIQGWCGIYPHKNMLGMMMALATIIFLLWAKLDPAHKWSMRMFAGASVLLLWLSDSKTSLLALLCTIVVMKSGKLLRRSAWQIAGAAILTMVLAAFSMYWTIRHLQTATNVFGRDATLSGRIDLWIFSVVMALQRPWFGYGYGAFWEDRNGPSARVMGALGKWHAFYAHNGLLEIWLDLGLISVIAFCLGFAFCAYRAIAILRKRGGNENLWPLALLAFLFVTNLAESTLLTPNNISWILYVAVVFLVSPAFQNRWDPDRVKPRT